MPWLPIAIGAGAGLLKNSLEAEQAAEERKRQAAMTRFSPWTGMHGSTVKDPNLVGNLVSGAAAGGMIGQAAAAAPAASAVPSGAGAAGAGQSQYSLMGGASNAAPFSLSQSPEAVGAAGTASKYSVMGGAPGGSAGALNAGNGGGAWNMMGGSQNPTDMLEMYRNMYAQR